MLFLITVVTSIFAIVIEAVGVKRSIVNKSTVIQALLIMGPICGVIFAFIFLGMVATIITLGTKIQRTLLSEAVFD